MEQTALQTLRRSNERGHADHGWLQSRHSFSFADYLDARHMGWGNLRVINEDRIAPGSGFGTHGHRDMEIISIVLEGALAHRDDIAGGQAGLLKPGDVQRMSAGSGVRHSEFNGAPGQATHFLQIWIEPDVRGIAPQYEQKHFDAAAMRGRFLPLVAPGGEGGALSIHADARLYRARLDGAAPPAGLELPSGRLGYVFVIAGQGEVNGQAMRAGDALALQGDADAPLPVQATALRVDVGAFDLLVFDLADHKA